MYTSTAAQAHRYTTDNAIRATRGATMHTLSDTQRQHLAGEGYLVVDGVLDPLRDLQPLFREYEEVLDAIARTLYAEGAIRALYRELSFTDRLIQICRESRRNFP